MLKTLKCNSLNLTSLILVISLLCASHLRADVMPDLATMFPENVPLSHTGAGSYSLSATVGGIDADFLLDTGASMTTVNSDLFKKIRESGQVSKVRAVGARLASGKIEVLDVYLVQGFLLGNSCELGSVEVAVLNKGGRNLLGMNVLQRAAPFAISLSPPALAMSHCALDAQQVSFLE